MRVWWTRFLLWLLEHTTECEVERDVPEVDDIDRRQELWVDYLEHCMTLGDEGSSRNQASK